MAESRAQRGNLGNSERRRGFQRTAEQGGNCIGGLPVHFCGFTRIAIMIANRAASRGEATANFIRTLAEHDLRSTGNTLDNPAHVGHERGRVALAAIGEDEQK